EAPAGDADHRHADALGKAEAGDHLELPAGVAAAAPGMMPDAEPCATDQQGGEDEACEGIHRLRLHDLGDPYAEAVLDHDHVSPGHQPPVDDDVDGRGTGRQLDDAS